MKGEDSFQNFVNDVTPWFNFLIGSLRSNEGIQIDTPDILGLVEATLSDHGGDAPMFGKKIKEYLFILCNAQNTNWESLDWGCIIGTNHRP